MREKAVRQFRSTIAGLLALLALGGCSTAAGGGATNAAAATAPVPAQQGAFATGHYRNLFSEWNPRIGEAEIDAKLAHYWTSLFGGGSDRTVYYPAAANAAGPTAYILDVNNADVRSEGMSYGMMIAVQMDRKAEFDALWNWAKTYMQYRSGPREGYFRWQCLPSGCPKDAVPASDGEEYIVTALFFAAHRWGNGQGIYDYEAEANRILDVMLHKEDMNGGVVENVHNMFDRAQKQVVFVPIGPGAGFTDPSYHLPAFYELWARWAKGWQGRQAEDRQFWRDAAARSRLLFVQTAHPLTGLSPDYAEFDGRPKDMYGHGDFRFDAFRVAVNRAVDHAWWAADANEIALTDWQQAFFAGQGMKRYVQEYRLDGTPLSKTRSSGLIASNGAASLAASDPRAWQFVAALWALQPPKGRYRYYNGLLEYMAFLHASGRFRIY
jgi:endo-1,4-beta-D-glucanase Y